MAIKRPCLGCGRLIRSRSYCSTCWPKYRRPGSTRAWRKLRLKVLARDDHVCHYCGGYATQADHVVPVSAGGRDELANLVAACEPCNRKKGAKSAAPSAPPNVSARDLVAFEDGHGG